MRWEQTATALSAAAPHAVWAVLLDGARWSFWNPGVEWMWLEGEPAPGTLATIKLSGVRQTAFVIRELLPAQRLTLGLTVGPVARVQLTWTLTPDTAGTRIDAEIAIAGIAAGLLLEGPAKRVARALPGHLERLAMRARDIAPAGAEQ
jgi:hypothetical protein